MRKGARVRAPTRRGLATRVGYQPSYWGTIAAAGGGRRRSRALLPPRRAAVLRKPRLSPILQRRARPTPGAVRGHVLRPPELRILLGQSPLARTRRNRRQEGALVQQRTRRRAAARAAARVAARAARARARREGARRPARAGGGVGGRSRHRRRWQAGEAARRCRDVGRRRWRRRRARGGITRGGEAIYRATLESLLASTGWTPRAAEEMAREEQRAHVRQMRWAREHGRGEPVRCFDAEEYDDGETTLSTRSPPGARGTCGIPLRGAAPSSRRP